MLFVDSFLIDTVIIMRHISLVRARHEAVVKSLIDWYSSRSVTAKRIRKILVDAHNKDPKALVGMSYPELCNIINRTQVEVPDISLSREVPQPQPQAETVNHAETSQQPRQTIMTKLFKRHGKKHK